MLDHTTVLVYSTVNISRTKTLNLKPMHCDDILLGGGGGGISKIQNKISY